MMNQSSRARPGLVGASSLLLLVTMTAAHAEVRADEFQLEEIIVTAEKRETNLQKTPQAINVITGDQLAEASITDVKDLELLVPGLRISRNGSPNNDISIRGISGNQGGDLSNQPGVATIVDGVYSQSGNAGASGMFDVAQVEVVKGPQGTVFGRNATAGVISFVSQKPKFENVRQVALDFGDYSKTNASGIINFVPHEKVAVRLAVQSSKHAGYYKDGFSDEDSINGRMRVLFAPTTDFSLMLTGSYSAQGGKGDASTTVDATGTPLGGDAWAGPTTPSWQGADNIAAYKGRFGQDAKQDNVTWSLSPQLDWKLRSATLTAIGSYTDSVRDTVGAGFAGDYAKSVEQSFEARFASDDAGARLKWQMGVYYYQQKLQHETVSVKGLIADTAGTVASGGRWTQYDFSVTEPSTNCGFFGCSPYSAVVNRGNHNKQENYALFTQETFSLTSTWRLTGGARWQREKTIRSSSTDYNYTGATFAGTSPGVGNDSVGTWNKVTWKAGVERDLGASAMAYAMVSTGWKAGVAQDNDPPYDEQKPEELTAYTLGLKSRLLDNRLQLNGEVFLWNYRNRQTASCVTGVTRGGDPVPPTFVCGFLAGNNSATYVQGNSNKSHLQGVSLDVTYRPWVSDMLSLNMEYLEEAVHDDIGTIAQNGCLVDCPMSNTPKWSGTLSYRHQFDLGDKGRITADARTKYESHQLLTIAATSPVSMQDAYFLTGAGVAYAPLAGKWSVRGYINNLEDKEVKSFGIILGSTGTVVYQTPRTYGVQLQAQF